jgi:hypothetical protein
LQTHYKIRTFMIRVLAFFLLFTLSVQAQTIELVWQAPISQNDAGMLWFTGAAAGSQNPLVPSYCGQLFIENDATPVLNVIKTAGLSPAELALLSARQFQNEFSLDYSINKNGLMSYCLLPVRLNPQTGKLEKLLSFQVETSSLPNSAIVQRQKTTTRVDVSVLGTGQWYKLGVSQSGVYKITPQLLADCGFSTSNLASSEIRLFGNGKGMLSEVNADNPNPELKEIPLQMFDGGDGVFSGNDYALFYANGPHQIKYNENSATFSHTYNIYSDLSYYFITVNNGSGKRMQPAGYNQTSGNYQSTSFDDYAFLEDEKYNLVGSGREWFGDLFDFTLTHNYTIQFQNVLPDTAYFVTRSVARSTVAGTTMNYAINGNQLTSLTFQPISTNSGSPFVRESQKRDLFIPSSGNLSISVTYNNSVNSSATAWLDYIGIQVRRDLNLSGNSIVFRDSRAYRAGGAALYSISNAPLASSFIWDVTDFHNVRLLTPTQAPNSNIGFAAPSDTLRTFVALKGSTFPTPSKVGSVANQNLHGLTDVEMVIVTYPAFKSEAERLATFHTQEQGLNVSVVTPEEIYNEFSSGMQDITAIKLFLRHLYKDSTASTDLRYLLLFGDASYDYKDRSANMHNFVPIYESEASFSLYSSFCTDDFFGFLDDNEGRSMLLEDLDIAIGRMPVKTVAEAKVAVDKVFHYEESKLTFGDWRLRSLLLADDVDDSWEQDFLIYTDRIEQEMDTVFPMMNFEKIYADSYVQIVKAGSQRYPDARADMFRKVERGVLVASYLGHGGEVGWAKERILQLADVTGWDNLDNMPVFTTVTCEFTRIDDPGRVSAGEQLFLNPTVELLACFLH